MKDKIIKVDITEYKKGIPILMEHDPQKHIGELTQAHIKAFNSLLVNGQRCILDPAYIIKESRKPTLKERIQDPGVKRIITDCEILEISIIPLPLEINYKRKYFYPILPPSCHHNSPNQTKNQESNITGQHSKDL